MKNFIKKISLLAVFAVAVTFGLAGARTASADLAPFITVSITPSQLNTLSFGGGPVIYTYVVTNPGLVAVNNVFVSDSRCPQVSAPYGDRNNNAVLDPGESWVYTCSIYVPVSATNLVKVSAFSNSFVASNYALASVIVAVPGFPNTGFSLN